MFVCLCNQVTTEDIEQAMIDGNQSFEQVQEQLGVADCCGQCEEFARDFISEKTEEQKAELFYEAA